MQNPRRPPAAGRRATGARERPVSWTRRMEEAREARARVLASREADDGDTPFRPDATGPATRDELTGADEANAFPETDERASRSARTAIPWRIAGGFLAGAGAGAVAVWALLFGDESVPPSARDSGAAAPAVASAPPDPAPGRAAQAPSTAPDPAPAATGPDEVAGASAGVAEPIAPSEVTAADRARSGARQTANVNDPEEAVADPPPDAAGSDAAAAPEDTADAVSASDIVSLGGGEPETADGEAPVEGSSEVAGPRDGSETGGEPGGTGRGADTSDDQGALALETAPDAGAGAVPLADADDRMADTSGSRDGAIGDEVAPAADRSGAGSAVEEPPPSPAPAAAEDPPQPPESPEAVAADVSGDAAAEAPARQDAAAAQPATAPSGIGSLYVHAAPRVTPEELEEVVASLTGAGYSVEETHRVDFRISQTNVRYFHEEDAEISADVAEAISGVSRDFTDYEPSPDPGTIEVWLEG